MSRAGQGRIHYCRVSVLTIGGIQSNPIHDQASQSLLYLPTGSSQDRIMSEEIWAGLGGDGVVVCLIYTPVPIGGRCFNYAVEPFVLYLHKFDAPLP